MSEEDFAKLSIEEKEKYVNDFIRSIVPPLYNFCVSNLSDCVRMAFSIKKIIDLPELNEIGASSVYLDSPRLDYSTKVKLVEDFYKSIGIKIDFNKMVSDEDVILYNHDDTIVGEDGTLLNCCGLTNTKPGSPPHLCNGGRRIEAPVYVHELAHYFDNNFYKYDFDRDMLDETIAISTELIFMEFAKEKYQLDMNDLLKLRLKSSLFNAERLLDWAQYLKAYAIFGEYNKKGFDEFYRYDESYEDSLTYFNDLSATTKVGKEYRYTMAIFLAPYIAYRFRTDPEFRKEYKHIYETKTFDEFMTFTGLNLNHVTADSFSVFLDMYVRRAFQEPSKKINNKKSC